MNRGKHHGEYANNFLASFTLKINRLNIASDKSVSVIVAMIFFIRPESISGMVNHNVIRDFVVISSLWRQKL